MTNPNLKRLVLSTSLLAAISLATGCTSGESGPGPAPAPGPDASLTVVNASSFVIREIYLAPARNPTWGANLLRGDVLLPAERVSLGVTCDFYDALLIDDVGTSCEISRIDLCLNNATWLIRNDTCTAFELTAEQREAAEAAEAAAADTAAR